MHFICSTHNSTKSVQYKISHEATAENSYANSYSREHSKSNYNEHSAVNILYTFLFINFT